MSKTSAPLNQAELEQLQSDAASCVKCALCAPHCPTFKLTLTEGESPRGRIALMAAATTGALPHSPGLQLHLDQCLSCRACEAVCPAKVPYGRMIDTARKTLPHKRVPGLLTLLEHPSLRRIAGLSLWGLGKLGLLKPLFPKFARMGIGKQQPARLKTFYPTTSTQRNGHVALFIGCSHDWLAPDLLHATVKLLTFVGFDVSIPKKQGCCGALRQHAGISTSPLDAHNQTIFNDQTAWDYVINLATGCDPTLKEQGLAKWIDLYELLSNIEWPEDATLKPLKQHIAIHRPCTQRSVLDSAHLIAPLLEKIPELTWDYLHDGTHCCGASGTYWLTQPEMASRLAADTLKNIAQMRPSLLVSSNLGCSLHLKETLSKQRIELELCHPLQLLARQI